jgi:hypothetical protein
MTWNIISAIRFSLLKPQALMTVSFQGEAFIQAVHACKKEHVSYKLYMMCVCKSGLNVTYMRAKQTYKIIWMRFSASVVMTITDLSGIQTLICTQTTITGKVEKEKSA